MRTTRLLVATATIATLFGVLMFAMYDQLGPGMWPPLVPFLLYVAAFAIAGGVALFVSTLPLAARLRRVLTTLAALPFMLAAGTMALQFQWVNVVPYFLLGAASALVPWIDANAQVDSPELFALVIGICELWQAAVVIIRPDFLKAPLYLSAAPYLPYTGLLGLAGGVSLLLPGRGKGVWAPGGALRQVIGALPLVAWTVVQIPPGFGFNLMLWGSLALTALLGPRTRSPRIAAPGAEQRPGWDPFPAHFAQALSAGMWLLVLLVVLATAVGGSGTVASPLITSIFVLSTMIFNVVTFILMPAPARPETTVKRNLVYLTLAFGLILLDRGRLGAVFLAALGMIGPTGARSFGRQGGRRLLHLGAAVLTVATIYRGMAGHESAVRMGTEAVVQLLALVGLGAVGIRSGAGERRLLEEVTIQRDQLGAALEQARQAEVTNARLVSVLEASPDMVAMTDGSGRRTYVNRAGRQILGLTETSAGAEARIGDAQPPWSRRRLHEDAIPTAVREGVWVGELAFQTAGGEEVPMSHVLVAHRAEDGSVDYMATVARDMRAWRKAEQALRRSEERFRSAFDNAPIGVALVQFDGRILEANRAFGAMLGLTEQELSGAPLPELLEPDQQADLAAYLRSRPTGGSPRLDAEWRLRHRHGQTVWAMVALCSVGAPDADDSYVMMQAVDITARKQSEAHLRHSALYDPLTDLMNRRAFQAELDRQLADAPGDGGALLFLDVDQFKYVNDTLGHQAGDTLLKNLGQLLQAQVRPGDVLARLGGDEFAFLLPGADAPAAQAFADRVLLAMRNYVQVVNDTPVTSTASIGIALYPCDGTSVETLLARADFAMYAAKELGRNRYATTAQSSGQEAEAGRKVAWEWRIREALASDGLVLFCQPILTMASGQVEQYEVLLRMRGDDGQIIPPGEFLPVAERYGQIQQIDRWVVRQAIGLIAGAAAQGRVLRLEVNLSARAFDDPELLSLIRRELDLTGIDPERLILEITETAAIADFPKAIAFMRTLRDLGCRFALDDFGAGFSSFSYLKRLPVDFLKLDGSYIRDLPRDPVDQQMVLAMVELARGLGLRTIAEFVEDAETLQLLKAYGVDFAQGYHLGRPAPLACRPGS